jgi:GNAT superfamily N-acetyltransferase
MGTQFDRKKRHVLRFLAMEINEILDVWNGNFGRSLPLSTDLLEATFFSADPSSRFVIEDGKSVLLAKIQGKRLHIHFGINPTDAAIERTKNEARKRGLGEIVFGASDAHLFPGVPLNADAPQWLRSFEPMGERVMDFEGSVDDMAGGDKAPASGEFRAPLNEREMDLLVEFVGREFGGRWYREILVDRQKNLMEHYFAYFSGGTIEGYARLYGWRADYWAPGVYFTLPGRSGGGLGPIGVAASSRGRGLGSRILKSSWKILRAKGCKTVRIDWTTEKDFYERAGLKVVQVYQPARIQITS